MNWEYFIYSLLFSLASITYYKIHKWWLKERTNNQMFYKPETTLQKIKNCIIIIILISISIIYFIKSIL
jgi:hypothetical protein